MQRMARTRTFVTLAAASMFALLTACGGGSDDSGNQAAVDASRVSAAMSSIVAPPGAGSPEEARVFETEPSPYKIRFFNAMVVDGQPGPDVDVYDNLQPSFTATKLPKGAKPLVKGLHYGEISDYVVPGWVKPAEGTAEVSFTASISGKPIGPDNVLASVGGLGEGTSAPQETMVFSGGQSMDHGLNGLGYRVLVEKAGGSQGDAPPATAPAGKAVFALDQSGIPQPAQPGATFFVVDDSCAPPLNGDGTAAAPSIYTDGPTDKYGPFPFFPADPGSHGLAVTFWPSGPIATCADVKPQAPQSTVDVDADTVYMTIPYGVDSDHIKIAVGAIAK